MYETGYLRMPIRVALTFCACSMKAGSLAASSTSATHFATIGAGSFGGPARPCQPTTSRSGKPASLAVGTLGKRRQPRGIDDGQRPDLGAGDQLRRLAPLLAGEVHVAAGQCGELTYAGSALKISNLQGRTHLASLRTTPKRGCSMIGIGDVHP